jgi:hypothetical protein
MGGRPRATAADPAAWLPSSTPVARLIQSLAMGLFLAGAEPSLVDPRCYVSPLIGPHRLSENLPGVAG